MRRVVSGTGADGSAAFVSDTTVDVATTELMPGAEFRGIWGDDARPTLPNDGSRPAYRDWFPPAAGYRVEEITIPPDGPPPAGIDMAAAIARTEAALPGLMGRMDPKHPGMHQTDTVDISYILSGQCIVELDSGAKVALAAGDTYVNNGSRHAWRVPFAEPCRVLTFCLGAARQA